MVCPLCGQHTQNASSRLIRDTCGHKKCRMCLLKEENGCTLCEQFTFKIDSLGSFDYPLPSAKSPNYEFPNHSEPLELTINKIPINLEINDIPHDIPQSIENQIAMDENNLQSQNNDTLVVTNGNFQESEINNTVEDQSRDLQNFQEKEINNTVEDQSSNLQNAPTITSEENRNSNDTAIVSNDVRRLVISLERIENIDDAYKNVNNQKNLDNTNEAHVKQLVYQDISSISSHLSENLNQTAERVETLNTPQNSIFTVQKSLESDGSISKLGELEKINLDLSNTTPKHLLNLNQYPKEFDSVGTPFRIHSERNEKSDTSPLPVHYQSPAFRMSDYILFKDRSSQDEVIQRIEKELNEGQSKSDDYISTDGFLVQRVSAGNLPSMIDLDDLQNTYFDDPNTAINDSADLSVPSCPSSSKIFMPISTINSNFKTSQKLCDLKETNSTSIKQVRRKNSKTKRDEDKENKKKLKGKEDTTKKSTKVDDETALKKVNLSSKSLPSKKNVNSLKIKSNKRKKKEENVTLNDQPIPTRRGERKRKRKILVYENEVLEVVTKKRRNRSVSPMGDPSSTSRRGAKRGRSKVDWSHVERVQDSPLLYKCKVCKASFGHWRGRAAHASCRAGEAPFFCEICDRNFYKRTHFEYHQSTHTGEKPFSCHLCDKSFAQKNKLNRHLVVHKQLQDVECEICGRTFVSKDYLKRHLISHKKNVPRVKCKKCPKTFTSESNCKRHENTHTRENSHNCDVCKKVFLSKFYLTRHNRAVHGNVRPFKCDICKRNFHSKFEIRRHLETHNDLKPFSCNLCKAKFRRKDNVKRHMIDCHSRNADQNEGNTEKKEQVQKKNVTKNLGITHTSSDEKTSPEVNEASVPYCIRPNTNSKHLFADAIPREEALRINQQIESKLKGAKSFCHYPGLSRKIDFLPPTKSSTSNSNSNDATIFTHNQNEGKNEKANDEPRPGESYVQLHHWRRRTAARLRDTKK